MLKHLIAAPSEPTIRVIEDRKLNTSETVKLAGRSTLVNVTRLSSSSGEILDKFTCPLGEAVDEGHITDTSHGTVTVDIQLDTSEASGFWHQPLQYIPVFKTFGVFEPDPFENE